MQNLILVLDSLYFGYKPEILFIFTLICIFFAISVIITKNPVLSVLFLIGLFFVVSLYLMSLGEYFIGLSYLLVYVGAISILFLFILMLINVRVSELLTEGSNSLVLALITLLSFNFAFAAALPDSLYQLDSGLQPLLKAILDRFNKIYYSIVSNLNLSWINIITDNYSNEMAHQKIASLANNTWDAVLIETNHITSIGNLLYSNYFILLIVTSFILLLAMVGTILITVKDTKDLNIKTFKP